MIRATILVASVLALAHLSLACVETGVPCGCDARDYGAAKDTCAWQKLSKALPPRKGGVIFYADYLTAPMCCTLTVKQQKVCCKAKPGVSMDVAQYQMLAQYRMIKACSTPDTPLVLNELQKQILDISSKVSEMCDAVLEAILKIIPDALRDIQVLAVRLHKIFDIMNELIDFISQSNCVLLFGSKTNVKFLGEEDPNKVAYSQTPEESGGGNHLISQYYGKAFTNPIDIMVPHNLFSHNNDLNAIINSLVSGFLKKYKGTNVKSSQKVPLQNAFRVLTLMSTFDYLNAMIMTKDPSQIIKDPKGTRVVKATGIKEYDDFLGELTKVVDLRLA